jgi:hypothetical protein
MKLLRYGPMGHEKPGLLDKDGAIRDLSQHVADIGPDALAPAELARLAKLDPAALPRVSGTPRLGIPVGGIRKFLAVGLNYRSHLGDRKPPAQPEIFYKPITALQHPDEAMFSSMPQSALDHVDVDHVSKLHHLASLLTELAKRTPVEEDEVMASDDAQRETEFAEIELARIEDAEDHPGVLAPFGCPDCGGTLWELREGNLVRFRCRVGHAWTSEALLARQAETLDAALWTALRALEESSSLSQQLAERARSRGNLQVAERLADNATLASRRADIIRDVLVSERAPTPDDDDEMRVSSRDVATRARREQHRATGSD